MRDRERQQTGADLVGEFGGRVSGHVSLRVLRLVKVL
jgi:hypothetical protein